MKKSSQKFLSCSSTPRGVKIRQGILSSPGVGKAKAPWGWGSGGLSSRSLAPLLTESVPQVKDLHPVTPGSGIVASVGNGAQLPHTDVPTHPEVLPPDSRDISGGHLSSFLCLLEDYQVAVQARWVGLGEAEEARWDTIQLQRGDMLLMVATSCVHGLAAILNTKDGLQGALLNWWTPDPGQRHHQPNTTHLDPPPQGGPGRCWVFVQLEPL